MRKLTYFIAITAITLLCLNTTANAQNSRVKANKTVVETSKKSKNPIKRASKKTKTKANTSSNSSTSGKANTTTTSPTRTDRNNTNRPSSSGNIFQNSASTGRRGAYLGGGVNTSTDGKSLFLEANPYLGYRFNSRANVGFGPIYQFRQTDEAWHAWGLRGFARYSFLQGVYASAEYEMMNFPVGDNQRSTTARMPVGGGMNRNIGGVNVNFSAMYDLLYSKDKSPYGSPFIFRGGINFGSGFGFGGNRSNRGGFGLFN
ncbi:MAG: hypothetical protein ACPG5B_03800 [Chitinophagales bacterium]